MPRTNITEFSNVASENTDINSVNIAENCPASTINDALRELMKALKDVDTGSQALTALSVTGALSCGAFTSNGIDDNADATAMTIDSSENVGIGDTSPDAKLDVHGNVEFGDGGGFDMNINGTRHQFSIGGNEYMRLNNDGDLFLGTTSATSGGKFEISFDGTFRNGIVLKTTRTATGTDFIKFFNSGGAQAGEINHNGSTTVLYTASSDYRLKENVSYNFDATTRLKNLKPCRFNFIADGADRVVDGFLAHEVSHDADGNPLVPEAVTGTHNEVDDDGNPVMQGIDQAKLVPLLTGALKEAIAKIEALEARITALENA